MITYHDITITRTDIKKGEFNQKKNKWVDYKKHKIENKTVLNKTCVYGLEDLFMSLKFFAESNEDADNLQVTFNLKTEY